MNPQSQETMQKISARRAIIWLTIPVALAILFLVIGVLRTPKSAITFASGVSVLELGLYYVQQTKRFIQRSQLTVGTVTDIASKIVETSSPNSPRLHKDRLIAPTVTFIATDGMSHTFTSRTWTAWTRYKPGQRVPIRYKDSDPQNADIATPLRLWGPNIIVVIMGMCLIAVSINRVI